MATEQSRLDVPARLGAIVLDKPFDVDELRAFATKLVQPADEFRSLYREIGGSD